MNGMPFRVDGKGQVLVSWMCRDKAYWSVSHKGATRFAPRVGTPGSGRQKEALTVAVSNRRGELLLVWLRGRQVAWALYGMDGKFTGKQGMAGEQASDNK